MYMDIKRPIYKFKRTRLSINISICTISKQLIYTTLRNVEKAENEL